ncbi:hypothetical protein D3C78_1865610 [compost metagenome]
MSWLPVGGMIRRIDCGRITRVMAWKGVRPIAREASHCPRGMLLMPARKISVM